jgi:hypothetical protein
MPARTQRIEDILLCYLQSHHAFLWPGADGLTLFEARDCYLQAMKAGLVPSCQELVRRYPELRDELECFFVSSKSWKLPLKQEKKE